MQIQQNKIIKLLLSSLVVLLTSCTPKYVYNITNNYYYKDTIVDPIGNNPKSNIAIGYFDGYYNNNLDNYNTKLGPYIGLYDSNNNINDLGEIKTPYIFNLKDTIRPLNYILCGDKK